MPAIPVLRLGLALPALLLSAATAGAAPDDKALGQIAARLLTPLALAPALTEACSQRNPQQRLANAALLADWRRRNGVDGYERSTAALAAQAEPVARAMAAIEGKAGALAAGMIDKNPAVCAGLRQLLAEPGLGFGPDMAGAKATIDARLGAAQAGALTLYSVAQLSALAQAAMAGRPRKDGLLAATAALGRLGPVAVTAEVVNRGRTLQTIEPERQSVMTLACFGYAQPGAGKVVEAWNGRQILVTGVVKEVWSPSNISMTECRILADGTGFAKAKVDDGAGFEMRRPSEAEAQAGPDQGIALADVADVLYKFTSSSRLDGFGNGYIDREEDTYVLLKDGTAFRHDWSFPFQDLNLPVVRRRQPDNWFRWSRSGTDFVLTHSAGKSAGQTIELGANTGLKPLPAGTTFGRYYYFLTIGMGGLRSDRGYDFKPDGSLVLSHSSLVAAKTAGGAEGVGVSAGGTTFTGGALNGFVASTGASGKESVRYRIDGYVISLSHADGRVERRSIGVPAFDDTMPPKSLYFGGETLWSDEKK